MGKTGLKVRGVNAGQAASVLVQQGHAKNEKSVKNRIQRDTKEENKEFKKTFCHVLELPTKEGSASSVHELVCMDVHKMIVAMTEKSQDFSRIVETLSQGDEIPLAI